MTRPPCRAAWACAPALRVTVVGPTDATDGFCNCRMSAAIVGVTIVGPTDAIDGRARVDARALWARVSRHTLPGTSVATGQMRADRRGRRGREG